MQAFVQHFWMAVAIYSNFGQLLAILETFLRFLEVVLFLVSALAQFLQWLQLTSQNVRQKKCEAELRAFFK